MMELLKVPFLGSVITVVKHNNEPYVVMRHISDGMGLAWQSQHEKIKNRFNTCVTEIVTQVEKDSQRRAYTCMPLRKLPAWLYTINPNKVSAEKRDLIIRYQNECDEVLWQYWTKGVVHRDQVLDRLKAIAEIEAKSKERGSEAGKQLYQRKIEKHAIAYEKLQITDELKQFDLFATYQPA